MSTAEQFVNKSDAGKRHKKSSLAAFYGDI
jgi:hypothetical protein